jgi:hypothetical protein
MVEGHGLELEGFPTRGESRPRQRVVSSSWSPSYFAPKKSAGIVALTCLDVGAPSV